LHFKIDRAVIVGAGGESVKGFIDLGTCEN